MKKSLHKIWVVVCWLAFVTLVCCDPEDPSPQNEAVDEDPIVTAKGSPIGDVSSASIGTSGGALTSADGNLTVTIPSGALSATTNISIQPISNEAPLGLGYGYRLEPESVQFAKKIQLTFHYNDQLLGGSLEDFLWIVTQADNGSWNAMLKAVTNKTENTVTVETSHFSDWSLGKFIDLSLNPTSKIMLTNKSLSLQVAGFSKGSSDDDELVPLTPITSSDNDLVPLTPIPPVESRLTTFRIKGWTLNGSAAPVSNGNGSLQSTRQTATYTAPNKKPSTNPVAVTVELEASNKEASKWSFMLTCSITVVEDLYLSVTIDGKNYTYLQYGYNGATPPDPNSLSVATCGLYDGDLVFGGTTVKTGQALVDIFEVKFENPSKGTRSFKCFLDDGDDDMGFGIGTGGAGYVLDYLKRTPNKDICDEEQLCGVASLTLTDYDDKPGALVAGHFTGTLYEDKDEFSNQCKTSTAHNVEGEFVLQRQN